MEIKTNEVQRDMHTELKNNTAMLQDHLMKLEERVDEIDNSIKDVHDDASQKDYTTNKRIDGICDWIGDIEKCTFNNTKTIAVVAVGQFIAWVLTIIIVLVSMH